MDSLVRGWLTLGVFCAFGASSEVFAEEESSGEEPVIVYDRGLRIGSPDGPTSLRFSARVQGRYRVVDADSDVEHSFSLPRIRLGSNGHVGSRAFRYKLQAAFEDGPELKDGYFEFVPFPKTLHLRLGKTKMPTTRHFLTSSGSLALVDRAITHRAFDASRGLGVTLHNELQGSHPITWAVGAYRDTTDRRPLDERTTDFEVPSFQPAFAGRLAWNHGDVAGFDEIDWEDGGFGSSLGVSVLESTDLGGEGGRVRAAFDWMVDYAHISVSGDLHVAGQHAPDSFQTDAWGFHQQVAALFWGRLSPAARVAVVDPSGPSQTTEFTGGLTYYFWRHRLKLGADASWLRGPLTDELRGRVQLQLIL